MVIRRTHFVPTETKFFSQFLKLFQSLFGHIFITFLSGQNNSAIVVQNGQLTAPQHEQVITLVGPRKNPPTLSLKSKSITIYLCTMGQKSLIFSKIHNFENLLFLTKFAISKSHFSQNSHFQSLVFHKIHTFKASFLTEFTF